MAERSVRDAFEVLLKRSVPLPSEREAASRHRASVEACLQASLDVLAVHETGSFRHGTGVRGQSDVDVLVSLRGDRPTSSDTALRWVRDALTARYASSRVYTSRPAVVVDFAGGAERWEVIPGFISHFQDGFVVYDIPGPASGWIQSAPSAHLKYVTDINQSPTGGAKGLARILKRWKYENVGSFKVSSFYLEMRAARYMGGESTFLADVDFVRIMRALASDGLADMNDPMHVSGRIRAASSTTHHGTALSRLRYDADNAARALEAERAGDRARAFELLGSVFLGEFPSRYYTT